MSDNTITLVYTTINKLLSPELQKRFGLEPLSAPRHPVALVTRLCNTITELLEDNQRLKARLVELETLSPPDAFTVSDVEFKALTQMVESREQTAPQWLVDEIGTWR